MNKLIQERFSISWLFHSVNHACMCEACPRRVSCRLPNRQVIQSIGCHRTLDFHCVLLQRVVLMLAAMTQSVSSMLRMEHVPRTPIGCSLTAVKRVMRVREEMKQPQYLQHVSVVKGVPLYIRIL